MLQDHLLRALTEIAEWEKTLILSSLQRITAVLSADSREVSPVLTTGPVDAAAESIGEYQGSNSNGEMGEERDP